MNSQQQTRSNLRRMIYNACRNHCTVDDTDTVKQMRDDIAVQLFGRIESELTNKERKAMLNHLNRRHPERSQRVDGGGSRFCTRKQANTVRNLAFEYGIYYHDYSEFVVTNKLGELMLADDIKLNIQEIYKNQGFREIPAKYKTAIWEKTANPKCNHLLIAAGYRPETQNDSVFYYEKMTFDEADYLIKRFTKLNYRFKQLRQLGQSNQISNN